MEYKKNVGLRLLIDGRPKVRQNDILGPLCTLGNAFCRLFDFFKLTFSNQKQINEKINTGIPPECQTVRILINP